MIVILLECIEKAKSLRYLYIDWKKIRRRGKRKMEGRGEERREETRGEERITINYNIISLNSTSFLRKLVEKKYRFARSDHETTKPSIDTPLPTKYVNPIFPY